MGQTSIDIDKNEVMDKISWSWRVAPVGLLHLYPVSVAIEMGTKTSRGKDDYVLLDRKTTFTCNGKVSSRYHPDPDTGILITKFAPKALQQINTATNKKEWGLSVVAELANGSDKVICGPFFSAALFADVPDVDAALDNEVKAYAVGDR